MLQRPGPRAPAGPGWARFDDLRAGTALQFPAAQHVLAAERPEDVAGVLQAVDDATRAGRWAFGHVSYEAAAGLDPALPGGWADGQPPLVWFGLCDEPVPVPALHPAADAGRPPATWTADWTDAEHARAVGRVREEIARGETYQCNLADRLRTAVPGDAGALYRRLALAQRGAHNAYVDSGTHVVASASPELFFEWIGDSVRTRPMKGTAARGRSTAEDVEQARRLRASAKERAENVMVVDLLRNDLGRVADVGSVRVDELFALERFPTVWQLTSQISARVRPGTGLLDVFRALFPCGSVTGAPKRRTMQLIAELEPGPRGVYCGAVGVVAPPGAPFRARFGVAIRTAVVDRATGHAVYGVGGGITWGSDAAGERAEIVAKSAVLVHDVTDHRLLETMAFAPASGLRNRERHLARLADSADWSGFRYSPDRVAGALERALARRTAPARVRLLLDRAGEVGVEVHDLDPPGGDPVRLVVDDDPVDSRDPALQHKTTRREPYRRRALRHPEADDVVLVNEHGEVTETTVATLAVLLGGRWWTPPTSSGCLPGVERARLLDLGRLHERRLRPADLVAAEAIAVVSSLRGWRPALLLDRAPAVPPGAAARR